MFNLYQIVSGAQGGQALDGLAARFGLSREQADTAVRALLPSLSSAFMAKAAQPGGLHELAGMMGEDAHAKAFADPRAAADPAVQRKGDDVAASVFGNDAILSTVVAQVAAHTGLPPETVRRMLPAVASIVVGGVASAMHGQGLGGVLGQIAGGGFGNIFTHFGAGAGQNAQAGQPAVGGFPGMVGDILSSMMGGHGVPPGAAPSSGGATRPTPDAPQVPPIMQAGLDALSRMFQPGVPDAGPHPGGSSDTAADPAAKR